VKLVVVGAGGHSRSVVEAIQAGGDHQVVGLTDPRRELFGTSVDDIPVLGDDSVLPELLRDGVLGACIGVGGSGDNEPRRVVFERVRELGFELPPIVHPAATVARSALLDAGTVVLAGAVVGPGAEIGENVVVNTGAVVEHDCVLEAHVHVATGALLGGAVTVERSAHVGIGASVIQGIRIGTAAVVGGGSVVIRDIEPRATVAGSPALPLRSRR
jgi:UDP-perosamine 4-acetyltransferase